MKSNTAKTIWGFLGSMVSKYTPLKFGGDSIEEIYNYLPISDTLSTSGQPTENQFSAIRAAGYKTIINLLPHNTENSLKNEEVLLTTLGMRYIHIPVNYTPTEDNFNQFVSSMQAVSGEKVWVHCAANARVSAFLYRYRCSVLGEDEPTAKKDLQKIWEPFGVWKKFISQEVAKT